MPADYVALARELPAVYQDDAESFAQLDGFLGMVDEVLRTYAEEVADVPSWLSPAASVWPPGMPYDAGADAVEAAVRDLYDALAGWFAFRVPGTWRTDVEGMARRREFAARAVRVWRRRGTPRGFLDWFCLYFGIRATPHRPVLLEHFKYGAVPASEPGLDPGLRATLVVPVTTQFREYGRRAEAAAFVQRYAPSHVLLRLCWRDKAEWPALPTTPETYDAYQQTMRERICGLRDDVDHGEAIHLGTCTDESLLRDRLDVGKLPTT